MNTPVKILKSGLINKIIVKKDKRYKQGQFIQMNLFFLQNVSAAMNYF